ncbi:MAG TPA: DUF4149 domain-containing protein [Gemmatimonadaceae bacterium]|jgi:hypothetical protein
MTRRWPERTELTVISVWFGAAVLTAAVVAPAAFDVLPTRTLAGQLVGRVLAAVFVAGAIAGILAYLLELATSHGRWVFGRALPLAMLSGGCLAAQFVVTPKIEIVRVSIGAPVESLDATDPRRVAFGRLHAVSVLLLGVSMLGAVATGWRLVHGDATLAAADRDVKDLLESLP